MPEIRTLIKSNAAPLILQAEQNAERAEAAAVEAALYDGPKVDTFSQLAAVTPAMLDVGGLIRVIATGAVYQRVSSGGDLDYSGAGGVRLNVLPRDGRLYAKDFAAPVTTSAAQAAVARADDNGPVTFEGTQTLTAPLAMPSGVDLSGLSGPAKLVNSTSTLISSLHTWTNWAYHQKFERLVLESNGALAAGSRVQTGMDVKESYYGTLSESVLRYFAVGLNLEGVYPWWVEKVHFEKCDVGIQWQKYAPGSGSLNGGAIREAIFDQCEVGIDAIEIGSGDHVSNSMFLDCKTGVRIGDTATGYSVKDSYFERASDYAVDAYGSEAYPGDVLNIAGNIITGNRNTQDAAIRVRGFTGVVVENNVFSLDDADACLLEIVGANTEVIWRNNKAIRFLDGTKFDITQLNLKTNAGKFEADVDLEVIPPQLMAEYDSTIWSRTNTLNPVQKPAEFRGRQLWFDHYSASRVAGVNSNGLFYDVAITETGTYTFAALLSSPNGSKSAVRLRRTADFVNEVVRLETLPKEPRLYTVTRSFTAGETARLQVSLGDNALTDYTSEVFFLPVCFKKSNAILGRLDSELADLENLRKKSSTAFLPTTGRYVGLSVWDTTLQKEVTWDGSAWQPAARWVSVPATATSTGRAGDIAMDANFAYFCHSTNLWRRVAVASW